MITSYLRQIAIECVPDMARVNWGDLWDRPFSEGSAFQWAIFAGLLKELSLRQWQVEIPEALISSDSCAFALWNSIPKQHAAQAGHSIYENTPLHTRFYASLVPRAIVSRKGDYFSIFREGCSYHQLTSSLPYSVRPDIVIAMGRPINLSMDLEHSELTVRYDPIVNEIFECTLAMRSSATIPIRSWSPSRPNPIRIKGIIECTTRKTHRVLREQLARYKTVFSDSDNDPLILTVSFTAMEGEQIIEVIPSDSSCDALKKAILLCAQRIAGAFNF